MKNIVGFPAIANEKAKILILGSMPSEASLQKRQYYGHNRNAFWPIMIELFCPARSGLNYQRRQQLLKTHHVAVWDVLQSCCRPGSLDANIEMATVKVNDFTLFFSQHRKIEQVFFNGAKAEAVFRKHILPDLPEKFNYLHYLRLPSTSPAHAAMTLQEKTQCWRDILQYL